MKNQFNSESLRPFIDMYGLKGDEVVERKRFSSKVTLNSDEDRTIVCTISANTEDADNDVIIPSGADLTRFTKNPVIHINHSYKVEDVVGKAVALSVQEDGIVAKIKFADTPKANDVWTLVKNGFVSANSIGFIIKEAFYAGTEEFKTYVKTNKIKVKDTVRRIISKFELLESSIVSIPSNPDALIQAISAKSITLSEDTIKELDLPKIVVVEKTVEVPVVEPVIEVKEEPKDKPEEKPQVDAKPVGPFPDFASCVVHMQDQGYTEEEAGKICGSMEQGKTQEEAEAACKPKKYIKVLRHGGVNIDKLVELRRLAKKGKIV